MNSRDKQIKKAAYEHVGNIDEIDGFIEGAKWADQNPSEEMQELIAALRAVFCSIEEDEGLQ